MAINGGTEKMTVITDTKQVYPEFKLFKEFYTRIKIAEKVTFYGENGKVYLLFPQESPYFIVSGELKLTSEFTKWVCKDNKIVTMLLSDINSISKALKKNVISVSYTETEFTFKFNEKNNDELLETELTYVSEKSSEMAKLQLKYNDICSKLTMHVDGDGYFNDELTRTFISADELVISNDPIGEKFLEIPTAKIMSLQKGKMNSCSIDYSYKVSDKVGRYIRISSEADDLKLSQILLTI